MIGAVLCCKRKMMIPHAGEWQAHSISGGVCKYEIITRAHTNTQIPQFGERNGPKLAIFHSLHMNVNNLHCIQIHIYSEFDLNRNIISSEHVERMPQKVQKELKKTSRVMTANCTKKLYNVKVV